MQEAIAGLSPNSTGVSFADGLAPSDEYAVQQSSGGRTLERWSKTRLVGSEASIAVVSR